MEQTSLSFGTARSKSTPLKHAHLCDAGNLRSAEIILADRERWEKECMFLVRWAELFMKRRGERNGQGPEAA